MTVQNEVRTPMSVRYTQGLLAVQIGCWVIVVLLSATNAIGSATRGSVPWAVICTASGLIAAAFIVFKGKLFGNLARGETRARRTAIGVEIAMTCFGSLGPFLLVGRLAILVAFPFFTGAFLSLLAVIGLLRPPAKRYCGPAEPGKHSTDNEKPGGRFSMSRAFSGATVL